MYNNSILEKNIMVLIKKIESLRIILNEAFINDEISYDEKLNISREMDKLINEYYKLNNKYLNIVTTHII
ncbi:aspartyl-phosphate phosphatase Spo0E family protein [Clostridium sp. MSJ-4]|uniref:Aspartyl-phosphate phosphatase Spo0E family protein n=1 Tax=Clostridium simiarum TaxID=2841506 RepID=A0ABS6F0N3_9CLOT|nr:MULTISPECIES: aspartyl-phosphate phosphatase Spo0E family protein [Clostridium]MBU5591142.1 aspartyl-phosphate phosphatase Spo0E family protein [Clostridium simiarum]